MAQDASVETELKLDSCNVFGGIAEQIKLTIEKKRKKPQSREFYQQGRSMVRPYIFCEASV
jgi:hypothetical protein